MFRFFPQRFTEYSNHYIDWSRVGELLTSNNHQYTNDQLIVRGVIATATAVSAYLGHCLNNENQTNCTNVTVSIAAGVLGFTLSHVIVIYPLIKKRYAISHECNALKKKIDCYITRNPDLPCLDNIHAVVDHISQLSLSNIKNAKASETWGRRKRLLLQVLRHLEPAQFNVDFWQNDVSAIITQLNAAPINTTTDALPVFSPNQSRKPAII